MNLFRRLFLEAKSRPAPGDDPTPLPHELLPELIEWEKGDSLEVWPPGTYIPDLANFVGVDADHNVIICEAYGKLVEYSIRTCRVENRDLTSRHLRRRLSESEYDRVLGDMQRAVRMIRAEQKSDEPSPTRRFDLPPP